MECAFFFDLLDSHGAERLADGSLLVPARSIYVPIGFAAPELSDNGEIVGGSAYGAAGIAGGDGSRAISAKELSVAKYQAKFFTKTVAAFVTGKTA